MSKIDWKKARGVSGDDLSSKFVDQTKKFIEKIIFKAVKFLYAKFSEKGPANLKNNLFKFSVWFSV